MSEAINNPQAPTEAGGKRKRGWLRYVGLLLLVILIVKAGPGEIMKLFSQVSPGWLLLAFALNLPQLGLKALRWQRLVSWQGMALGYTRALAAYFSALLVGFITPGRLGEMVKVFTLRRACGATLARGLSSVVLDRMFDMYLLLSLGALGLLRFALVGDRLPTGVFVMLCCLLALPPLALSARVLRIGARWLAGRGSKGVMLAERVEDFAVGVAAVGPGRLLVCVALTAMAYAIFFLQCFCCTQALGFTIPFVDLVLLMAATNFISFIPISVSGLGTREACLVFFLGRVIPAQTMEMAVSYGLSLFVVLFVGGGVIGWLCWRWSSLELHEEMQQLRRRGGSLFKQSNKDA